MQLRSDFDQRAVVLPDEQTFVPSPLAGVERVMLDRVGDEVARATSLVRYAPGSRFSEHVHGLGEEILVLDGTFEDEFGRYPAGSWIRSPAMSRHHPFSREGCTLYVKVGYLPLSDDVAGVDP